VRIGAGDGVTERASVGDADTSYSLASGIARGAGVIAILTLLARVLGLLRTLVFSQTVGATCLGTAYFTANQVPNLVYELVIGGALGSAMVPVLARSAERSIADPTEKAQVSHVTSALLTWTLVILVPLTLMVGVAAGPISALLTPANPSADCVRADLVATTANMLRVFAPQALLYGLTVVLFGLLQAYRRFAGYALAPLVSSLVLIASYLAFAPLGRGLPLSRLSSSAQLVLSVGATLAVAAMVLVGLVPTWRLRLRLRPAFRFPPGVARRAGGLVAVGLIEVVFQQVSAVAVIALANGRGDTGALVMFNYASQVFNSLNAVLALSIVLSAFPVLSARDGSVFDRTCAGSTRAVALAACLGMAVIGAVAVPAAHVLARQPGQVPQLIAGFAFFAPGLVGMGVLANLTRALLAIGRLKVACVAVAGSSLLAALAQVVLAEVVPPHLVVAALALGNTIGMTGGAIPLVIITRRIRGKASVQGIGRAVLAGLGAATAAAVVGVAISVALPASHKLMDGVVGALAAGCAVVVFCAVAFVLDDGDLRVILARVRQAARFRLSGQAPIVPVHISARAEAARQHRYDQLLRTRKIGQVPRMNTEDHQDRSGADETGQTAGLLTRRERQGALGIGVAAGVAGGFAVFATSNQAGTFALLLISLVFLLAGVEGTSLIRVRGSFSGDLRRRVRPSHALRQADDEHDLRRAHGLAAGVAATEPEPTPRAPADIVSYRD
jgi:putative peptidoglycan lipid II flippase